MSVAQSNESRVALLYPLLYDTILIILYRTFMFVWHIMSVYHFKTDENPTRLRERVSEKVQVASEHEHYNRKKKK
jgi:hypothetical protein